MYPETIRFLIMQMVAIFAAFLIAGHITNSLIIAALAAVMAEIVVVACTWRYDFGRWRFWR